MPEVPDVGGLLDLYWSGPERRISSLTLRIIGVNAAALVMLALGTLYLGQYQSSLIEAKLETFGSEVELVAAALSESAGESPDGLTQPHYARMVKRLSETMQERIYLFNANGQMILDSDTLPAVDKPVNVFSTSEHKKLSSVKILKDMTRFILKFVPDRQILPVYVETNSKLAQDYPDAIDAMNGTISMSAWHSKDSRIFLTSAAPLFKNNQVIGAVMLARQGHDIEEGTGEVWANILIIFGITLIITIVLSIYLSGTIASPLRRLAAAAEALRTGKSKDIEIPDFSERRDEIGELSIVMRQMTQALWDRMDSIERFAADVAHELKNPLTSLKSAVETVSVVKKEGDRRKLMEIIAHDVERMDRLISDISNASRLDAELSREALQRVDIYILLRDLINYYKAAQDRKKSSEINITLNDTSLETSYVWGLETRLAQVFENLISNAVSFSPERGEVNITITPINKRIVVTVEDQGPGIPENRLEKIFDRFYTERPSHEDYGRHSGLGLSICKQIVTALGGQIFAENIKSDTKINGARFTVILGKA